MNYKYNNINTYVLLLNIDFNSEYKKNWGRVHKTLGDSERLPLPHTKGTKPAPSSVKVSVYLIQVKKYFLHKI